MSKDVASLDIVINRTVEAAYTHSMVWLVELDGKNVGTIAKGGRLAVHSAPGRHTIVISPRSTFWYGPSRPFEFDAAPGQQVNISVRAGPSRPSIWRPGTKAAERSGLLDKPLATQLRNQFPRAAARSGTVTNGESRATLVAVIEESRYEIFLGGERRIIDNSQSSSPSMRVVRLTKEWVKRCTIDAERITTVRRSAELGITVLALKAEAERTLKNTYSTTIEQRETFEEEVTINVAPRTRSVIMFSWKEIRQRGLVKVTGESFEARIPYEVAVGLTFDQQQIDT